MRLLGWPPYPWQETVADAALEVVGGRYRWSTVGVCVGRQAGKTSLVASRIVLALLQGRRAAYTAQDRVLAREKWEEYSETLMERLPARMVRKWSRSNGQEHLDLVTGGRFGITTPRRKSGRGRSNDLVVVDEALTHESMDAIGALMPTMATKPWAQLWLLGNAGNLRAVMFRHFRDLGRSGRSGRLAWFEWAPADAECSVTDRTAWWQAMPTLGLPGGVQVEAVEDAAATMAEVDFRMEYLNQWSDDLTMAEVDDRISEERWALVRGAQAAPAGALMFAVDTTPDRGATAVTAASASPPAVEVVDERAGVDWAVARCAELVARHGGTVAFDGGGQAATVGAALAARGVPTKRATVADMAQAAGLFDDAVTSATVVVRPHPALDRAVVAARKGKAGERWRWTRAEPDDNIAPLVAASLAWWAAVLAPAPAPRPQVF